MGVRLDMALGTVLAILTVTFLTEGGNCSPSIQLPVWKQKLLKNLPTFKKTPGSTALLTLQDHGNSFSPYSYSRPSAPRFFSSNNYYNNYYSTSNRYSPQQSAVRKPIPFQSSNRFYNRFQPVKQQVTTPRPSSRGVQPINNKPFDRLKPGYPYRTPTAPATTTTTTTTTTKAPIRFRARPTPATRPPTVLKALPAVPAVPAQPKANTDERILNFVQRFVTSKLYNSLQSSLTTKPTTTTTPAPVVAPIDDDDTVLDFSSGEAQVVKTTVEKVEPISEEGLAKEGRKGFNVFKGLIDKLGLEDRFADEPQGAEFTIFTPGNSAFYELPYDVNALDDDSLLKLITKHFVRGAFKSKDLPDGPVETLSGESINVSKNENGKVRINTGSGEAKIKIANIKTKWGIVHVVDKVFL